MAVINGTSGNDTLIGTAAADVINGLGGDDMLTAFNGTIAGDVFDGGDGTDTVSYVYTQAIADLGTGVGTVGHETHTLLNIENLWGGRYDDRLTGNGAANSLRGGDGNDILHGAGGNDILEGGAGGDTLDGGAGQDTVVYAGMREYDEWGQWVGYGVTVDLGHGTASRADASSDILTSIENVSGSAYDDTLSGDSGQNRLRGGAGDDVLTGAGGADVLDGGDGFDTASYAGATAWVAIDLAKGTGSAGDAAGDTLSGIELVIGSSHGDILRGDAAANLFDGGAGADILDGRAGIDTVTYERSASGVQVSLLAGAGAGTGSGGDAQGDVLTGIEALRGSGRDDILVGDAGANTLDGGDGNDRLEGGAGSDFLQGGAGSDTASYAGSATGVSVDLGTGTNSDGDLLGGIENLTGSGHADTLRGDNGDNVLEGGAGADVLDGGTGADTASYERSAAAVQISLLAGTVGGGDAQGDSLTSIENLFGSAWNDVLAGDAGDNRINGGAGNDRIDGGTGRDYVYGGGGDDWLVGGAGDFTLSGDVGSDTVSYAASAAAVQIALTSSSVYGHGGDAEGVTLQSIENIVGSRFADTLTGGAEQNRFEGGAGADTLDGGLGIDTASYAGSAAGVVVNLLGGIGFGTGHGGDAEGDVLRGVENLVGSAQADTLSGDGGDNVLEGGAGADFLFGRAGTDIASYAGSAAGVTVQLTGGGSGQPTGVGIGTSGDAAGDRLYDIENVLGSAHADRISGDHNDSALWGNGGDDALYGNGGNDSLDGGAGNDRLVGGAGADIMVGGDGIDTAYYHDDRDGGISADLDAHRGSRGTAAGDTLYGIENLYGSDYRDVLTGDDASNVLTGGHGDDVLTGRGGADIFAPGETGGFFPSSGWEVDTITDFSRVQGDKIDLRPIDADGNAANGDTAFTIVTGGVFTGAGHEAILHFIDGGTEVLLDINGNGLAEMVIKVQGFSLAASDLLL